MHAFSHCEGDIESVFISKNIQVIETCGFQSTYPTSFIFEEGSELKEIKDYGIGWIKTKFIVLPPSLEILHENSFRGFDQVKHLYYCGTYTFDNIKVFTTTETNKLNLKIIMLQKILNQIFNKNFQS